MVGLERVDLRGFSVVDQRFLISIEATILTTIIDHSFAIVDEVAAKRNFRLDSRYFVLPLHKAIVEIITECQMNDKPFDAYIISYQLQKRNQFDEVAFLDMYALTELPIETLRYYYEILKNERDKELTRMVV